MPYFSGRRQARRFSELDYAATGTQFRSTKLTSRAAGQSAGVRVPELLGTWPTPADVDLSSMSDRFVLKTDRLASKRGVFLLTRRDDGFFDLFRQKLLSAEAIMADMQKQLAKRSLPLDTPVLAEEFVVGENGPDEIPYDYKLYTFDGSVEFILQVNRNTEPTSLSFFGSGFEPLERHCIAQHSQSVQIVPPTRPANCEQMIDAARKISLYLDMPFISVDLYTTGSEVILGELTPRPGGPYYGMWRFSDEFDVELGTYYRLGLRHRGIEIPIIEGLPPVLKKHQDELAKRARLAKEKAKRAKSPPRRPLGIKASVTALAKAVRRRLAV